MAEDKKAKTTKDHFEEKAEVAKKNQSNGGAAPTVDLTTKVKVRFTKDVVRGNKTQIKKGHEQYLSQVAYEIYLENKEVEKIG